MATSSSHRTSPKKVLPKNKKFFGTDGVRGLANSDPITAEQILNLAQAIGTFALKSEGNGGSNGGRVIIGKDTRLSGYMLEPALTAGLIGTGCDVFLLGPLPTPAVAHLTKSLRADMGIMISASHNPYSDNGIKIFRNDGLKLSDTEEDEIEALLKKPKKLRRAAPQDLGRARRLESARGRYVEFVKSTFPSHLSLQGLKIVVDCANGAAYRIAPEVLYELGADVIPCGVDPDGFNINDNCGATNPQALQNTVLHEKADLGLALDGDADRVIMCDSQGRLFNGDKILGLIATYFHKQGRLKGAVVGTVMANLGLQQYLQKQSIKFIRTPVGDRHITATMLDKKSNLGGEQSGHVIIGDYGYGGDGLLAALQILAAVLERGKTLDQLHNLFTEVPQKLINMPLKKTHVLTPSSIDRLVKVAEKHIGKDGRILVRKSGTEPLIRLMGEAKDEKLLSEALEILQQGMNKLLQKHKGKKS